MTEQSRRMGLWITFFLVSVAGLAACASSPVEQSTPNVPHEKTAIRSRYTLAATMIQDNDKVGGEQALREVAADSDFEQLSPVEQHWVLTTVGHLALSRKDAPAAYDALVRSSEMPQADDEDWYLRSYAAAKLKKDDDMINSFLTFLRRWPQRLTSIDENYVNFVVREARRQPNSTEASRQIMEALFDAHWKMRYAREPSDAWKDLSLALLDAGKRDKALEVSASVDDPYDLIAMRVDRRFKDIVELRPETFDTPLASSKYLKELKIASEQFPMSLDLRRMTGAFLKAQGKYTEALAILDSLISDVSAAQNPKQQFERFDRDFVWVLNDRAMVLGRLGRWEEAIAQLQAAVKLGEGGNDSPNVSQRINLAELYCDLDRPKDALAEITQLDPSHASPYGVMQAEHVRFTAAVLLGDRPEAARALAYLREHRLDAPLTFEQALLDENLLDEAAKSLVDRLNDPTTRSAALMSIQRYLDEPEPKRVRVIRERWQRVVARPEVKAAVAAVGKVERFPLEDRPH